MGIRRSWIGMQPQMGPCFPSVTPVPGDGGDDMCAIFA